MEQNFRPHPVFFNYEASRDGVVRHRILKNPVAVVSNMGYLAFSVGKKRYLNHTAIYEAFNGLIEDGFVIDHKNGVKTDSSLENLEAVTQSQNTKQGRTGTCKSVVKRPVKSFDTNTNEQKVFQSMIEASKYFDICIPSVRKVAEGIYQTVLSKKTGNIIQFSYFRGDKSLIDSVNDKSYVR